MTETEPPTQGAGDPDGFERLWGPHRMPYIRGENKPRTSTSADCPFCRIQSGPDEEGLVVRRGRAAFAVLNLYPYGAGHLMVCPYRHVPDYTDLTADEAADVAVLTQQAMTTLRKVSGAQGFNVGMNQGEVAGAGIAAHLHQHVVPRWEATPTLCRWSRARRCSRSCSTTPEPCWRKPGPPRPPIIRHFSCHDPSANSAGRRNT